MKKNLEVVLNVKERESISQLKRSQILVMKFTQNRDNICFRKIRSSLENRIMTLKFCKKWKRNAKRRFKHSEFFFLKSHVRFYTFSSLIDKHSTYIANQILNINLKQHSTKTIVLKKMLFVTQLAFMRMLLCLGYI